MVTAAKPIPAGAAEALDYARADDLRRREHWAMDRMRWSLAEYALLSERYARAVRKMESAIQSADFAGFAAIHAELAEISDQTSFLNTGFGHAVESVRQQELKP